MKKIKSFFGITAWLVAMMLLALACNDDMDINKVYAFDLVCMPVQKKIVNLINIHIVVTGKGQ